MKYQLRYEGFLEKKHMKQLSDQRREASICATIFMGDLPDWLRPDYVRGVLTIETDENPNPNACPNMQAPGAGL